jgi:sodium/pantothenate symporter
VSMLLITAIATYWAIKPPEMIVWINLAAFGALQAVFLWPIIAGVFWKEINGNSAFLAMIAGLLSYLALQFNTPLIWHVHPIAPALALSLFVMLVAHLISIWTESKVLNSESEYE